MKAPRQRHEKHDTERERAAADWLARRDAGFSPAEAQAFALWRATEPRAEEALRQVESAWELVNRPRERGQADRIHAQLAVRERHRRRRRTVWGGMAAAGMAALVVFGAVHLRPRTAAEAATVAVLSAGRSLPDGSRIDLDAGAEIAVDYSPARRFVRLRSGSAHFSVAKDPGRPFVVTAGGIEVRALGTEFAVRLAPQAIDVLVTEGEVAVGPARGADSPEQPAPVSAAAVRVSAGRRVTVPGDGAFGAPAPEPLTLEEIRPALAWRGLRTEFSGTPLSEVVQLFNRHNRVQLAIADPALAALRVSGIYRLDDPEGFSRLLEASFELRAERREYGSIVLHRAP